MENRIREFRQAQKLSQEDLARIAHVSRQTVNAIENDKYDPELLLAFKLAEILGTKVDDLFTFQLSHVKKKEEDVFWCEKYQCVLWKRADV
ncbi:MAG: helix-turn-helix transcriptional regulator [Lactococcus sp.]|nr:helix-turn-helix transcriptional regulator [Lactococcus sp.]